MKKDIKFRIALVVMGIFFLQGCIDDAPNIGEPFDKVSNLTGTWSLTSVVQNDEVAISKGFPAYVQSVDLTQRVGFSDYQLLLETDVSGTPTTFTENSGSSPSILGVTSGDWSLDDPNTPTTVTFTQGSTTKVLGIGSYVGLTEGNLTLKITKTLNEKPILSYVYQFQKITN